MQRMEVLWGVWMPGDGGGDAPQGECVRGEEGEEGGEQTEGDVPVRTGAVRRWGCGVGMR